VAVVLVAHDVRLGRVHMYSCIQQCHRCVDGCVQEDVCWRDRMEATIRSSCAKKSVFLVKYIVELLQVFSRQSPDPTVEQNVVDVVDVPDSAGFVVSSKAVYSFRKHGVLARSAARTCLPSLVPALVLNLTEK
jgi:hypothetical protein